MQKYLLVGLVLAGIAVAKVGATEAAVRAPGTRVFLSPPEGFSPSERFFGFVKKDASASLVVTEIHGPYEQVITSFSKGELEARGMNLTASSIFPVGKGQGSQGSLIEFTQVIGGKKFKKITCVFGDKTNTTIVSGAMPDSGSEELLHSLRHAVKSARFDSSAKVASLDEGLPFTISDTKKFKKASRLQNVLVFTTSDKTASGKINAPIFAVSQSPTDVTAANRETFAKERLAHTPQVKNITIDKENLIKQAGLDGEEFLAQGVDAEDGIPTYVFHTVLFDKGGYYIFQGLCPMSERTLYEPEYQQLVKNFQLRSTN